MREATMIRNHNLIFLNCVCAHQLDHCDFSSVCFEGPISLAIGYLSGAGKATVDYYEPFSYRSENHSWGTHREGRKIQRQSRLENMTLLETWRARFASRPQSS